MPKQVIEQGLSRRSLLYNRFEKKKSETLKALNTQGVQYRDEIEWVKGNRWIDGKPWSYESPGPKIEYGKYDIRSKKLLRPYLFQLLRDKSPMRSVIKSRQTEMTENHINEALFYILTRSNTRVSHVFPTDSLGYEVSNEKIAVAIRESPLIQKRLYGVGSVQRYMFNNNSLYAITGAYKKGGGRAGSRDIIIYDEWDLISPSIEGVYSAALEHSSLRLVRKVGTPSVPEVGIDKAVKEGSEETWFWKCKKCKIEQDFRWPDNLINYFEIIDYDKDSPEYIKKLDEAYIGCRHCAEYINRNSVWYVKNSRWIAKRPQLSGINASYRMNAFMIAWKTGKELLSAFHGLSSYVWQFFGEKLGLAYLKSESRISEADILKCQRKWRMAVQRTSSMFKVVAGIDWGDKYSYIIISCRGFDNEDKDLRCIVYMEEINDKILKMHGLNGHPTAHVERAAQVISIFQADVIINDAGGLGVDRSKQLLHKFPLRNWGAFFDTAENIRALKQSRLIVPQWNDSNYKVTFSKVTVLKEVQNAFKMQKIGIPMLYGDEAEIIRKYIRQTMNGAIQPRWNQENEKEIEVYVKLGEDHFGCANLYAAIGDLKLTGLGKNFPGVVLKRNR